MGHDEPSRSEDNCNVLLYTNAYLARIGGWVITRIIQALAVVRELAGGRRPGEEMTVEVEGGLSILTALLASLSTRTLPWI
jgi:hypothetical protein